MTKAKEQWSNYVSALKGLGVEIIQVPADDRYPDCVFIADLVVIREGTVLITRPGHGSRRGEELEVRNSLEKLGR